MQCTRCLDLVHAICESELSHLSYPNSKRTALPCYTFQKEKKSSLEEEKRAKPRKTIRAPILLLLAQEILGEIGSGNEAWSGEGHTETTDGHGYQWVGERHTEI